MKNVTCHLRLPPPLLAALRTFAAERHDLISRVAARAIAEHIGFDLAAWGRRQAERKTPEAE